MLDVGIHLPQYGRVAGPESVTRAAALAEARGFAGVWVSDHLVQPADQDYPSPYLLDPMITLTWAAAVTSVVGLGTSVLVAPQHNPLEAANQLASLDRLSGGRLTVGVGVGWSAGEYAALGYEFGDRGDRLDELLDLWRVVWRDDPATFHGRFTRFDDLRVLPQPAHDIPIWVGGSGTRARRRAIEKGDGFHLIGLEPEQAAPHVHRLRRDRPEDAFTISLRTGWDPLGMDPDVIRREHDEFTAAGIQHVVSAPWRTSADDWLRAMESLAALTHLTPR
ncbi:MAG: TIGR03619 family F420-dependent LLM class oxidoreductase [Acidimicrobiales bacterium]|nr:TIGR03619 family F420-dependent LLM class oxidoreductase [Acidimicrobiales bacterium]